jgi:hypothetical protein
MTRAQVRHIAANKLAIIQGNAELTQSDPDADLKSKHRAKIIERAAKELFAELMEMYENEACARAGAEE